MSLKAEPPSEPTHKPDVGNEGPEVKGKAKRSEKKAREEPAVEH